MSAVGSGFGNNGPVATTDSNLTNLIDVASTTTTYIGNAAFGSATSSPVWQISRVLTSGTLTSIQFAGGTDGFNQIWDNRASLTYSN